MSFISGPMPPSASFYNSSLKNVLLGLACTFDQLINLVFLRQAVFDQIFQLRMRDIIYRYTDIPTSELSALVLLWRSIACFDLLGLMSRF